MKHRAWHRLLISEIATAMICGVANWPRMSGLRALRLEVAGFPVVFLASLDGRVCYFSLPAVFTDLFCAIAFMGLVGATVIQRHRKREREVEEQGCQRVPFVSGPESVVDEPSEDE